MLLAFRSLLEAAQLAQVLELRRDAAPGADDAERRVAAGISRCALAAVEREEQRAQKASAEVA